MDYVGKTLAISAEHVQTEFAGAPVEFMQYNLDQSDPLYIEIKNAYPKVRFKWPGKLNTADIRMDRFNVVVNEAGLITQTYYG